MQQMDVAAVMQMGLHDAALAPDGLPLITAHTPLQWGMAAYQDTKSYAYVPLVAAACQRPHGAIPYMRTVVFGPGLWDGWVLRLRGLIALFGIDPVMGLPWVQLAGQQPYVSSEVQEFLLDLDGRVREENDVLGGWALKNAVDSAIGSQEAAVQLVQVQAQAARAAPRRR